jgi:hypothetical protein
MASFEITKDMRKLDINAFGNFDSGIEIDTNFININKPDGNYTTLFANNDVFTTNNENNTMYYKKKDDIHGDYCTGMFDDNWCPTGSVITVRDNRKFMQTWVDNKITYMFEYSQPVLNSLVSPPCELKIYNTTHEVIFRPQKNMRALENTFAVHDEKTEEARGHTLKILQNGLFVGNMIDDDNSVGATLYNSGDSFYGRYFKDNFHEGTYKFANGDVMLASFRSPSIIDGTITHKKCEPMHGDKFQGTFKDLKKHGQGVMYIGNMMYAQTWDNGKLTSMDLIP